VPGRPRFDHVAATVNDLARTVAYYANLGCEHVGTIQQHADPRGFATNYLKSGDGLLYTVTA
jgi:catechol 2,3-dioxygenase-like lactoylglutathione lyase family enzyme